MTPIQKLILTGQLHAAKVRINIRLEKGGLSDHDRFDLQDARWCLERGEINRAVDFLGYISFRAKTRKSRAARHEALTGLGLVRVRGGTCYE